MLDGLQTEINQYPELTGASNKIIMDRLNSEPGQTETWVVRSDDIKVPKGDMLALLSAASQVKLFDWMDVKSDAAKGFSLFYLAHDQFKVADPVFRGTMELLYSPLELITEAERDAILRLGERSQTRAEELWGRSLTAEDFE